MIEQKRVIIDCELNDIDDFLAILYLMKTCFVSAITTYPGSLEQAAIIKMLVPSHVGVGAYNTFNNKHVNKFHYEVFDKLWHVPEIHSNTYFTKPNGTPEEVLNDYSNNETTLFTGAPIANILKYWNYNTDPEYVPKKWVGQGGFVGENIQTPIAENLKGRTTSRTFNFGNSPISVDELIIKNVWNVEKQFVSKNVTHACKYDKELHKQLSKTKFKETSIYKIMDMYLKHHEYKKFHDVLAAMTINNPDIVEFKRVNVYRKGVEFGAYLSETSNVKMSVNYNHDMFVEELIRYAEQ